MMLSRHLLRSVWLALLIVSLCALLSIFVVNFYTDGQAQEKGGTIQITRTENQTILVYSFLPPLIEAGSPGRHRIYIPGLKTLSLTGEPMVPFRDAVIVVPAGKQMRKVTVIPGKKLYIGRYRLEPASPPVPPSYQGPTPKFELKAKIYAKVFPYPGRLHSEPVLQYKSGIPIIFLNLYPVEFIPATRRVSYYESLTLVIEWEPRSGVSGEQFAPSAVDLQMIKHLVDNPEDIPSYEKPPEYP